MAQPLKWVGRIIGICHHTQPKRMTLRKGSFTCGRSRPKGQSWVQWYMPIISALGKQRQEECHKSRPAWFTQQVQGQPELLSKTLPLKRKKLRTGEMAVKTCCSCRGPGLVPSTHIRLLTAILTPAPGIQCPLLASVGLSIHT